MMTIETYTLQQIRTLLLRCEKLEIELYIDDISYSVDFFATINGKRKQCIDLIDEGTIPTSKYDEVAKNIAEFIRGTSEYKKSEVNKYKLFANVND